MPLDSDTVAPAVFSGRDVSRLTMREKAAVVVRLLLSQGAVPALSSLSETQQTELAVQIARMKPVDTDTVAAVAEEFANAIERIGLSFPTGIEAAMGLLDGVISEGAAGRLRQLAPGNRRGDPWAQVAGADTDRLAAVLQSESVEVAAVILSKLKVSKAADVLGKLPGDRARQMTFAISQIGSVSPEVVYRIGVSLAEQLDMRPPTAFTDGPVARVGAILNYASASVRDDVLDGLQSEDEAFARDVRAAIFTFANIPERIAPRDVPRIQRDLDQNDIVTIVAAAAGPDRAAVDFLLANISQRLAENIRTEAGEKKNVKADDAEAAMRRVVTAIRGLETAGEIFFVAAEA